MHFGLHKPHVFPTHFMCFIVVHSGLAYTRVKHGKPNMHMRIYYYTTESMCTFCKFRAGNVNNVKLSNEIMTMCILIL